MIRRRVYQVPHRDHLKLIGTTCIGLYKYLDGWDFNYITLHDHRFLIEFRLYTSQSIMSIINRLT